ncbi:MAG: hypothetical protein ACI8V2_004551, partial [Candidatus Latescibacterota bacterium]
SVTGDLKRTLKRVPNAIYRLDVQDAFKQEAFATFDSPAEEPPIMVCTTEFFPTFSVVKLQTDRPLSQFPHMLVRYAKGQEEALLIKQTGLLTYEAIVNFDPRVWGDLVIEAQSDRTIVSVRIRQQPISKRQGGTIVSDDELAMVRFESDGVYETLFGRVMVDSSMTDARMVGRAYRLMPDDVAFEKAEVILRYPEGVTDTSKVAIYTWDIKKGWVFVDIGRDSGMYAVNGEVKHLGVFALLVDDVPPEIVELRPGNGQAILDRQPKVLAMIHDVSSGIWREEDIEMRIDGNALIVEYDPEEDLIFATPRKPLAVGAHQIEVVVRDICGNEARQVHSFVVE